MDICNNILETIGNTPLVKLNTITQEVDALGLPGITTTREDGTMAVRYERLVPILIEAIKELEARVKTLEG